MFCAVAAGCRSETAEPVPTGAVPEMSVPEGASTTSDDPPAPPAGTGTTTPPAAATTNPDVSDLSTTTAPVSTTTTSLPWSLPAELAAQVAELMDMTEGLRGRAFYRRPVFETLTADEAAERHPSGLGVPEREDLLHQMALLELLGMARAGTVSVEAVMAAFEFPRPEPVYDFRRAVVVIPGGGEPLDEYQQWVLVGELVHALTHQHEPLLVGSVSGVGEDRDRTAARIALLEGEAVLVQSLYLDSLPPERRAEVARQAGERSRPVLDEVPSMLVELARFPYRAGSFLATELYRLGGMAALDQALGNPPDTTEHVLHLDRYRRQEPAVEVKPLGVSAEGYELVEEGTWGERRWRTLLEHHSGPVNAARAAEGWGGDHYQILWEPLTEGLVLAARYAADSFGDESEMNAALRELVTSGMEVGSSRVVDTVTEWIGGAGYALVAWDVGQITVVLASDPEVGRSVASQLGVAIG